MLMIDDVMRSMIASAMVAGGDCDRSPHDCLCCGDRRIADCALIVGEEYAEALVEWVYGECGCGFHHEDIRRGELGMEAVGPEREQTYLDRIADLISLYRDQDELLLEIDPTN